MTVYNNDEKCLIWLDMFSFLTYKKKELILSLEDTPSQLKKEFKNLKSQIINIIDEDKYNNMVYAMDESFLNNHLLSLQKQNVICVTKGSNNYPQKLHHVDCPPFVLYCKGNIDLLNSKAFAIVGTRRISNYGRNITEMFARDLSAAGFCIVSGLASGVDTVAHQTTLDNNGKTIAVLAGGFNEIYPPTNYNMAQQISKVGLLVTEYKPTEKSEPFYFPIRNRIIAALSEGVLITEADEKSGAMHTKNYALDNNIDVFAVPGNINSPTSKGCNNIIKNAQAQAVTEASDILANYNIQLKMELPKQINLNNQEKIIVELLKQEEKSFQEIIELTKIDTKTLSTLLTTLSIRGIIKKLAGNNYGL